ncbi:MAG: hypothetical protein IJV48_06500 [Ruminococcus sp.]|nr:hypothetical protein [Ruminococcus sp.]
MSQSEYDSFYYEKQIVELADALDDSQIDLLPSYKKDKLFCPECHLAKLRFTRKTTKHKPYLATKQPSKVDSNCHDRNCSHFYDTATKEQAKAYYTSLTSAQIEDKLNAAINLYLKSRHSLNHPSILPQPDDNPSLAKINHNGVVEYKRLPKRSIYTIYSIEDDLLNIPILLYGIVRLESHEEIRYQDRPPYYKINVLNSKTGKKIRFFYRARNKDKVSPNQRYYFACIAVLRRDKDYGLKSDLYNQQSIKYIPFQ